MASSIGSAIRLTVFGESHGSAIGAVVDGLPVGESVDLDEVGAFLCRRAPAQGSGRREPDRPEILSGLYQGKTNGSPLCAILRNQDARPVDYDALRDVPRPSHADYPARVKYGGFNDPRGGGHFSGRLTAPLCFAGAVCAQLLERRGVTIGAHLLAVGAERDVSFDPVRVDAETLRMLHRPFPTLNPTAEARMRALLEQVRAEGDSLGGIVECAAVGLPVGLGEPIFEGVENRLSSLIFGIPAVRGVEFGDGFAAASLRGSEHNDPYTSDPANEAATFPCAPDTRHVDGFSPLFPVTNHAGGVLGGLTTGAPLIVRAAFKPTPTIARAQRTARYDGSPAVLEAGGRHDPCVAPRAVPCVEAAAALGILELWKEAGLK